MNQHFQTSRLLMIVGSWFLLAGVMSAFDFSRLDLDDQRLLAELNFTEVMQPLASKAITDNAITPQDAASVIPLLKAAQSQGVPLAAIMYADWMNQDQMRRVLTFEFKLSFINGGIDWKHVPILVDAFLAARDSPVSIYFHSTYTYRERLEMEELERIFRDAILDNLHYLAYPETSTRPQRNDGGHDRGNAPTLKRMLEATP